ncbi:MAG: hypothetical protein RL092_786 [Bacteroidota bacterium]|jgi:hypothetical integral membrane protein (TIGR02206 family)
MKIFSTEHLLVIAITLLLCIIVPIVIRKKTNWHAGFRFGFGSLLLINILVYQIYRWQTGYWGADQDLPMHLCAWANIITALALFYKNNTLAAIAWCWVMMGSINGLITPQLDNPFPEIPYIYFVIGHSGLMIAVTTLVYGLKIKPQPRAWFKVVAFSQVYFFAALLVNYLTHANYGYLDPHNEFRKQTILALFPSEAPWFHLAIQAVGAILFGIALIPFVIERSVTAKKESSL